MCISISRQIDSHNFCWGQENFEGKEQIGSNCLCYYAYYKMTAAKMTFVNFFAGGGQKNKLGAASLRPSPWLCTF